MRIYIAVASNRFIFKYTLFANIMRVMIVAVVTRLD